MKTEKAEFPETLQEAITYFSDPARALEFMISIRWPDGVARCPRCDGADAKFMPKRSTWRCRGCNCQFSAKVGTVFEESPIGLDKWFPAFWMIVNAKNGTIVKIGGHVEADETFIGGKARNRHFGKRKVKGSGPVAMTPVMGLLERSTAKRASRVILKVVATTKKAELQSQVCEYVLKGYEVHTDALKSYQGLADEYTHNVIDHAECYVRGHVHKNGLENFWSLLKRAIKGTYVSVEPFHLFRYLDEQAFRFNERKNEDGDKGRFLLGLIGIIGKRLTYKKLIGQDGGGELLPA